jgi:hypothetical protein
VSDGLESCSDGSKLLALPSAFARDNSDFITLTRERARSYWAAYYRPRCGVTARMRSPDAAL